ncbi:MAG TPA: ABC transporter permease, partial [Spirochaetia bacterium]|nr:ABC transporter permease [Spirochaetia bacterium]
MSMKDVGYRFKEFWDDFRKETSGLIGLGILALSLIVVLFEPVFLPFKDVDGNWRNISYWQDSPPAAPPAWTNLFAAEKSATTAYLNDPIVEDVDDPDFGLARVYTFKYNYKCDKS